MHIIDMQANTEMYSCMLGALSRRLRTGTDWLSHAVTGFNPARALGLEPAPE